MEKLEDLFGEKNISKPEGEPWFRIENRKFEEEQEVKKQKLISEIGIEEYNKRNEEYGRSLQAFAKYKVGRERYEDLGRKVEKNLCTILTEE